MTLTLGSNVINVANVAKPSLVAITDWITGRRHPVVRVIQSRTSIGARHLFPMALSSKVVLGKQNLQLPVLLLFIVPFR